MEDHETIESDTIREMVDVEGVTQTVLEGELVASPETAAAVESGHVKSQLREDDTIETHLIRRRTIEEEMGVRKEITGQVSDVETLTADAISRAVVESEIVDGSEYDVDLAAGTRTHEGLTEDATGTTATTGAGEVSGTISPTEDDEGKTVVNADGDEIGIVVAVESGQTYVDPHPSITDRIRTALGWGDHDEDTYPVETDQVARIDDDRVVLSVDRER